MIRLGLFLVLMLMASGQAFAEVCDKGSENWKPAGQSFLQAALNILWPESVVFGGILVLLRLLNWRPVVFVLGSHILAFGLLISNEWRDTLAATDPVAIGMVEEGCRSFYSDVMGAAFFITCGLVYLFVGFRMQSRTQ